MNHEREQGSPKYVKHHLNIDIYDVHVRLYFVIHVQY